MSDGLHFLTAAHCAADSTGKANITSATVTFFHPDSTTTAVGVAQTTSYPGFNGSLAAGGDLALLTLSSPVTDVRGFEIYRGSNEIGSTFSVLGFGQTGTGATGQTGPFGQLRRGMNQFESVIGGTFDFFAGWTAGNTVLVADFDDGTPAHDGFGRFFGRPGLGLGVDEAGLTAGDSGGPALIGGRLAGMGSFAFRVSTIEGSSSDTDGFTNATFGEFNSYTRISAYQNWIDSRIRLRPVSGADVPEPATWSAMATGLTLAIVLRRRRRA